MPGDDFGYVCTVTLTLGVGQDTSLDHEHLCEILSRSNIPVCSYGLDTNFVCVHCDTKYTHGL